MRLFPSQNCGEDRCPRWLCRHQQQLHLHRRLRRRRRDPYTSRGGVRGTRRQSGGPPCHCWFRKQPCLLQEGQAVLGEGPGGVGLRRPRFGRWCRLLWAAVRWQRVRVLISGQWPQLLPRRGCFLRKDGGWPLRSASAVSPPQPVLQAFLVVSAVVPELLHRAPVSRSASMTLSPLLSPAARCCGSQAPQGKETGGAHFLRFRALSALYGS
jgi:hypothetical protein